MRHIDHLIIHCSATQAKADFGASDIDRWHRDRGWWGNGYHYVIRRNGLLETHANGNRCRPLEKAGAHVGDCGPGWNKRSLGICLIGGVDDNLQPENNFTTEQWEALKTLLRSLRLEYPEAEIMGHRDLIALTDAPTKKACPSFYVGNALLYWGI